MSKIMQMIERILGGGPGGAKRVQTFRWLLIIGLVGVMFMIFQSFINVEPLDSETDSRGSPPMDQAVFLQKEADSNPFAPYEEAYEQKIKELLEKMAGVRGIEVMVTIDSTEEHVVYTDTKEQHKSTEEVDRNGASRQITEVSREGHIMLRETGGGSKAPITIKSIKPKIRGVVIVAGGAENAAVEKMIVDSIRKGLDVPVHRISVVPRKQQ